MDCSTPGFPVHHQLPELAQTHVHQVGDAIQPFHPLWSPYPPALNLSQHPGLFQGVGSSHQGLQYDTVRVAILTGEEKCRFQHSLTSGQHQFPL